MSEQEQAQSCEKPSRGRYVQGCRCPGCKAANSAYQKRFEARKKKRGGVATPYVGAKETKEARERLKEIVDRGVPLRAIARETGIARSSLQVLLGKHLSTHPRSDGGQTLRMSRRNYMKIMELSSVRAADRDLVPAMSTIKILQKLSSMGMKVSQIARLCGMSYSTAYRLVRMDPGSGCRIAAKTAKDVRKRVLDWLVECGVEVDEYVRGSARGSGDNDSADSARVPAYRLGAQLGA